MDKNTIYAVVLSMGFLVAWWFFFQPKPQQIVTRTPGTEAVAPAVRTPELKHPGPLTSKSKDIQEKEIIVETNSYKAVFTTRGAAVKHWFVKEHNGSVVDLVMADSTPLATFPGLNYTTAGAKDGKIVFTAQPDRWLKVIKTYELSDNYLHNLTIKTIASSREMPATELIWDGGISTDDREKQENPKLIRVLGFTSAKPNEIEVLKKAGDFAAASYKWFAVDNRYFLSAFIMDKDGGFESANVTREKGKQPVLTLNGRKTPAGTEQTCSLSFYLGPKGHAHLKSIGLELEEAVDFGWFGFLGKLVLKALTFLYGITQNYGWAIVILTIGLQLIVLPLSLKSFQASIAMKKLQPHIKELQVKFKGEPQRLNAEMMNLYKTKKVNPLGGCLPMLLQLPIFWALFTTLRNAYELRGASWLLWVKDLSAPDTLIRIAGLPINILPLVMGAGMFLQQKMMGVSTDPAQEKMMYLMPIIFTFIFWNFPSGLVLYWLINNILSLSEQYYLMKKDAATA